MKDNSGSHLLPKVLVSVPKKRIKRAVDRNLLKRRIKEAYRNMKQDLTSTPFPGDYLAIVYVGKEIISFEILKEKLILVLLRLKGQGA